MKLGAVCLPIAVVLTGCTSGPKQSPDPLSNASISTDAPLPDPVGATGCKPPSPARRIGGGVEVRGAAAAGSVLWALVSGPVPVPSGSEVTILWSMSGSPKLRLTAVGSDGSHVQPSVLLLDAGAVWDRSGIPWTSTFTFPLAGCWRIVAQRGDRLATSGSRSAEPA